MTKIKFGNYEPELEKITTDMYNRPAMQHIYLFANGYGASVIKNSYSYGHEYGLYELAVMKDGRLCYDTPITDNVIGYLTADKVAEHLSRIEKLPDLAEKRKEGSKLCNT